MCVSCELWIVIAADLYNSPIHCSVLFRSFNYLHVECDTRWGGKERLVETVLYYNSVTRKPHICKAPIHKVLHHFVILNYVIHDG